MNQDPPAFQLFTEIGIIDQLAGTGFARAMPRGITRAQFVVLNHLVLRGEGKQSPALLAAAIQVTRATMTSTLARMERAGLISLRGDPHDGRGKLVSITSVGRAIRESCITAVLPMLPLVAQALSETEVETALLLLRRLRSVLDAARDPVS